eukprot:6178182-Pleurochrysis_carterae.AAC.1
MRSTLILLLERRCTMDDVSQSDYVPPSRLVAIMTQVSASGLAARESQQTSARYCYRQIMLSRH